MTHEVDVDALPVLTLLTRSSRWVRDALPLTVSRIELSALEAAEEEEGKVVLALPAARVLVAVARPHVLSDGEIGPGHMLHDVAFPAYRALAATIPRRRERWRRRGDGDDEAEADDDMRGEEEEEEIELLLLDEGPPFRDDAWLAALTARPPVYSHEFAVRVCPRARWCVARALVVGVRGLSFLDHFGREADGAADEDDEAFLSRATVAIGLDDERSAVVVANNSSAAEADDSSGFDSIGDAGDTSEERIAYICSHEYCHRNSSSSDRAAMPVWARAWAASLAAFAAHARAAPLRAAGLPPPPPVSARLPRITAPVVGLVQRVHSRVLANVPALVRALDRAGYDVRVIVPERLSPREQLVTLFNQV